MGNLKVRAGKRRSFFRGIGGMLNGTGKTLLGTDWTRGGGNWKAVTKMAGGLPGGGGGGKFQGSTRGTPIGEHKRSGTKTQLKI